jgi:secreted trypsin-like serine protease
LCLLRVPNLSAINPNAFEPVCLPSTRPAHGQKCYAAGWGTLESSGSQPDTLQDVGIWTMSNEFCKTQLYSESLFSDDMICAGTPDFNGDGMIDGGKDACQGDSGGPLVCVEDGVATLVGVTSWGIGCAYEGYPGVWSSVADNLDWIAAMMPTTTTTTTTTSTTTKPTETATIPSSATSEFSEKFVTCLMIIIMTLFCL